MGIMSEREWAVCAENSHKQNISLWFAEGKRDVYLDQPPTCCTFPAQCLCLPPAQPRMGLPHQRCHKHQTCQGQWGPSMLCWAGIVMTNWKWGFIWERLHVQTPLTNQLSKGFCSFEAQKLLPLTAHSPGWREKGCQCWQVHLKLENFKVFPVAWLFVLPPDYCSIHCPQIW